MPFKKSVIPYLDRLSLEAEKTQSVNTIYLDKNKVVGTIQILGGFELVLKIQKI